LPSIGASAATLGMQAQARKTPEQPNGGDRRAS
jgi:hypothetical protein